VGINFLNNHLFWFLKSFCSRELAVPGSFWGKKKIRIKELLGLVISKTAKN
jgi:hypothetical protein